MSKPIFTLVFAFQYALSTLYSREKEHYAKKVDYKLRCFRLLISMILWTGETHRVGYFTNYWNSPFEGNATIMNEDLLISSMGALDLAEVWVVLGAVDVLGLGASATEFDCPPPLVAIFAGFTSSSSESLSYNQLLLFRFVFAYLNSNTSSLMVR